MAQLSERNIIRFPGNSSSEVAHPSINPPRETGIILYFSQYRVRRLNEELRTEKEGFRTRIEDHLAARKGPHVVFKKPADLGAEWSDWFVDPKIATAYVMVRGNQVGLIMSNGGEQRRVSINLRGARVDVSGTAVTEFDRHDVKEHNLRWLRFANALMDNIKDPRMSSTHSRPRLGPRPTPHIIA